MWLLKRILRLHFLVEKACELGRCAAKLQRRKTLLKYSRNLCLGTYSAWKYSQKVSRIEYSFVFYKLRVSQKRSTLYKISSSKFIFIFESKKTREKLQVTEKHSSFRDKEIILSFQKRRSGALGNGKEPIFGKLFLPECLRDQAVRLAISNFDKGSAFLLADINIF